jgi:hypothetical protein
MFIFFKDISLARVVSVLLFSLCAGCATRNDVPKVNLAPVVAARIFSEDTLAARLLNEDQRQWFVGAAYFISRNGRAFTDNDQLFEFLENDLGRPVKLKKSAPVQEVTPGTFAMTLGSGDIVNISVSGSRITLICATPEITNAVVQSMITVSGANAPESNAAGFGWAHALTHIFR